jgi:hypothetical protein
MDAHEFDWGSGEVQYWTLDVIDVDKPLSLQLEDLQEDLAQIAYGAGIVLDLGWYPAGSINGAFGLVVVRNSDWTTPLLHERFNSLPLLRDKLAQAVRFAERAAAR